jgi:hypothetical protein
MMVGDELGGRERVKEGIVYGCCRWQEMTRLRLGRRGEGTTEIDSSGK